MNFFGYSGNRFLIYVLILVTSFIVPIKYASIPTASLLLMHYVSSNYNEYEVSNKIDIYKNLMDKMNRIQRIVPEGTSLHRDPRIIELYYSIIDDINESSFRKSVIASDQILKILIDSDTKCIVGDLDNAYENYKNAMNFLSTYIYTNEFPLIDIKIRKASDILRKILLNHLKLLRSRCKDNGDFAYKYDSVNDPAYNFDTKNSSFALFT